MTIRLKKDTASQEIPLGYFVDETDGKTAETGLTINNTDIKLWKSGATTLADKNSGGATHIAGGIYYAVLDATDTNTLGPLVIFVHVSGALPVRVECEVQAANVYDSLVAASDNLQVDTIQVSGTTQTARDIGASVLVGDKTGFSLSSAGIQAIWDALTAALTTVGSIGKLLVDNINATIGSRATQTSVDTIDDFLDTEVAAILADTNELQTDWVNGGRLDLLIDGIKAKTDLIVSAATLVDNVWDEALAGHGSAGTAGQAVNGAYSNAVTNNIILDGMWIFKNTIGSTGNDSTHVHLPGLTYPDDTLIGYMLVLWDSTTWEQHTAWITDWDLATELATVTTLPITPEASTDYAYVYTFRRDTGLTAAEMRTALGLATNNLDTQLAAIDDYLDTEVAAILADTNELQTDLVDGGRLDLLIDAIKAKTDNLPTDPADASDIASSFTTVNTKLDAIDDYIDTEVAAIKAKTDNLPASPAATGDIPSAASIADAVWDEATAGHVGAGSTSKLLIDTLDAAVSSRASQASLDTLDDYVDTEVAAIKAKTDNLPADPADASDIAASFTTVNTKLDTIDDYVDSEVAAIKAATDLLNSAQAEPTVAPAANATPLEKIAYVFAALRNKLTISGTTKTFYDDAGASLWTKALSDDGSTYTEDEGS